MTFTNKIIFLGLVFGFTNGFNTRRHDSEKKIEEIRDILFTVKTTAKNHKTRVKLLLDTWAPEALENVSSNFGTVRVMDDRDPQTTSFGPSRSCISHFFSDRSRKTFSAVFGSWILEFYSLG